MRSQALQILAEVLDFSVEEKRKIKLPVSGGDGSTKNDGLSANHVSELIDDFFFYKPPFIIESFHPAKHTSP